MEDLKEFGCGRNQFNGKVIPIQYVSGGSGGSGITFRTI